MEGGEDVEESLEALGERVGYLVERGLPLGDGGGVLWGCVLPEVVCHQDRALGVALDELEQRVEGLAGVAVGFGEPLFDVGAECVVGELAEADGCCLSEQGSLALAEELVHQPGLGAREQVACRLAVVLDMASDQAVEPVEAKDLMELVEGDEDAVAGALVGFVGQLEQSVQRGEGVGLGLGLELGRDPAGAEGDAEVPRSHECAHGAPDRPVGGAAVGVLDPHGNVAEREHATEVDDDRRHLELPLSFDAQPANQRGLAVAPRSAQSHEVRARGEIEQALQLVLAVDQVVDGSLEDERVTGSHGQTVADATVYPYRFRLPQ